MVEPFHLEVKQDNSKNTERGSAYQNTTHKEPGSCVCGVESLGHPQRAWPATWQRALWWTRPPQEKPGPCDHEASPSLEAFSLTVWLELELSIPLPVP